MNWVILGTLVAIMNAPLWAQMGGQDGMGMMDGLIAGRNGGMPRNGSTGVSVPFSPTSMGMPMSLEEMEGPIMGMSLGPFVNNGVIHTLTRSHGDTINATDPLEVDWVLSAYDLAGVKKWSVTLKSDMLSAPVFGPDGHIILAGRDGMGKMLGRVLGQPLPATPASPIQFDSVLYLITPGVSPIVTDVKFDGQWISKPTVASEGNGYTIYLISRAINLDDWNLRQWPVKIKDTGTWQQWLYAISPKGEIAQKFELE